MDTARAEVDYDPEKYEYFTATTTVEARTLDLTDQQVLDRLGVDKEDLILTMDDIPNPYEITQQIGDIAKNLGYEAILYSSAKTGGRGRSIVILSEELIK